MKAFVIVDIDQSDTYKPFVCLNQSDAEEMVLSFLEEETFNSFNICCQLDDLEDFHCMPTRFLPWDDKIGISCQNCDKFMCEELKDILDSCNLISLNHYEIVETEII